jgi:Eukaryotic aspartyl protease
LGLAFLIGKFDGILGMAFDSISVGQTPTPFQLLMEQGQIKEGVFAFYLGGSDGKDGELILVCTYTNNMVYTHICIVHYTTLSYSILRGILGAVVQ